MEIIEPGPGKALPVSCKALSATVCSTGMLQGDGSGQGACCRLVGPAYG